MATNKKRKIQDELREFKKEWTFDYAFVPNTMGLPTCLICNDKLSNNKKSNVERHLLTKHGTFATKYPAGDKRKRAVIELQRKMQQSSLNLSKWTQSSSNVTAASIAVSYEIAKHEKPFTDGEFVKQCFLNMAEHLFGDFKNKEEITKKIKDTPLSAKTIHDRTIKMSTNVTTQQIVDLRSASVFSLACDESCDVKGTAQVSLLGRYVSNKGICEELLALLPLKEQTRGEDIYAAIFKFFTDKEININNLVSIATDGAPSMRGKNKGVIALFKQNLKHDVFTIHCIIHQEALCAQTFPPEIVKVMDLVVKIVNQIMARGLNQRQFCAFLQEVNSQYSNLLLYNKVRWLSRGAVLKRFALCLEHIKTFLIKKQYEYPELSDDSWLQKFYFAVDMTSHLNQLNKELQGRGNTANTLLETVLSFEQKLLLFEEDMRNGNLLHFETLKDHRENKASVINTTFFVAAIIKMQDSFNGRFNEFRNEKPTLSFLTKPLEADVNKINYSPFPTVERAKIELQLADLKTKDLWSSKFTTLQIELQNLERKKASLALNHKWTELSNCEKEDKIIFETWNSLPECYNQLKIIAFGILTIFGSTYYCEQAFPDMNGIKSKQRNQLSDISLESCLKLKTSNYKPNREQICAAIQSQKSH